jgi:hypothetical protein
MFSRQTFFHTMFLGRKPGFMGSVSRDGYKLFVVRVCFCFWILTDLRHVLKDQWHRDRKCLTVLDPHMLAGGGFVRNQRWNSWTTFLVKLSGIIYLHPTVLQNAIHK